MGTIECLWSAILLVLISGLLVFTQGGYTAGEKFHFNYAVKLGFYNNEDTQRFDSFIATGLRECLDMCKRIHSCSFINYFVRFRLCDMITTQSPATRETVLQAGVIYANKSEWDLTVLPGECQTCAMYEECVTISEWYHTCIRRGCRHPEEMENTKRYGNMYNLGNTVKYVCNISDTYSMNVCQQDGQWSSSNFSCEITTTTSTTTSTTSTTSTTTTTTVPACVPADGINYHTDTLSNGDIITYHMSTGKMKRSEGVNYCNTNCGQMIEVYTMEKYNFLVNVLETNSDYNGDDFYIDGTYDDDKNKWYTNSGIVISTTLTMWNDDGAKDGSDPCIRMKSKDNYHVDDTSCSEKYRVLCENV